MAKLENRERLGFFDIETTGLKANYSMMLSYCIKPLGEKEVLYGQIKPSELRSSRQDQPLLRRCVRDLEKFDRIVTFYGSRFDLPYIRSRCLHHGIPFPEIGSLYHTDLYDWCRRKLKLHSHRLQSCCEFLHIPSKGHPMTSEMWNHAVVGDRDALDYVLTHNIEDVISTERLFKVMLPFCRLTKTSI